MKFQLISDLHLDINRAFHTGEEYQTDADVVLLPGDIAEGIEGFNWVKKTFKQPSFYVNGNHEYYTHEINSLEREFFNDDCIMLQKDTAIVSNSSNEEVKIIGATLWTDFNLYEDPEYGMQRAYKAMNDYRYIKLNHSYLKPIDTLNLHKSHLNYIAKELENNSCKKSIVMTHHVPHIKGIAPEYKGSFYNVAFASDLEEFILYHQPDVWVFGHTHASCDFKVGKTRLICNPKGYGDENKAFNPQFTFDL
jgi:predicted phosphodiesterase